MKSKQKKVVNFITYSEEPLVSSDDVPLARELEILGFEVRASPWDGGNQLNSEPEIFVIRSPWNYDSAPDDFLLWLERLEQSGHRVINPYSLIRWNIHKGYLIEAASRGMAIPKTEVLQRSDAALHAAAEAFAMHEYVVMKPTISLSAHHTSRIRSSEIVGCARQLAASEREYMIQEFIPEITAGELSFVFFGGQFSHCIRKTPKAGDFRTQGDYGAARERYEPTQDEVDSAAEFLALAPQRPLFARVDLVKRGVTPLLMELELIDPMLFFKWAPQSEKRLANLIAESSDLPRVSTEG